MHLRTLLPLALCVPSLTAQNALSDQQRAEIRQIVREEIHAAIAELHKGQAVVASPKVLHAGPVQFEVVEAKPDAAKTVKPGKGEVVELTDITEGVQEGPGGDAKGFTFQLDDGKVVRLGGKDVKVFTFGEGDEGGKDKSKAFTFQIDGKNVVRLDGKAAEGAKGACCCEESAANGACCEIVIDGDGAAKAEKAKKAGKKKKGKKGKKSKDEDDGKELSFRATPAAGTVTVVGAAK
ncbi:MAG TPA: hypothetical protein VFZ65_18005 [Planctomycetota bacterium]|nr:hypothetical protein [Planctomycetota bacterium]